MDEIFEIQRITYATFARGTINTNTGYLVLTFVFQESHIQASFAKSTKDKIELHVF